MQKIEIMKAQVTLHIQMKETPVLSLIDFRLFR